MFLRRLRISIYKTKRMGVRRFGSNCIHGNTSILKKRANMSFMLVVMFFAVFGLIVLTEIFLIDERQNTGLNTGFNRHRSSHRLSVVPDLPDYEEIGPEDYGNFKSSLKDHLGFLFRGDKSKGSLGAFLPINSRSLPTSVEARLPQLDQSLQLTNSEWLPVKNTRFKFYVYSAYYDERSAYRGSNSEVIRVIGATKTRGPEKVWCRLWYLTHKSNNVTISITVAAKVKVIRENWNLKYSACFVVCPLPKQPPHSSAERLPATVSIVARLQTPPTNRILVQNRPIDRPKNRQALAICVKPLHYEYNRVNRLIEFIELHKILGASHVTLYNDTLGKEAGCALKYYEGKGLVTLLPWHHLDMISQREIRTEGLFAALNDCLYRSMYNFEYLALLDLDEFIIPRREDTIPDLIRWMSRRTSSKTTSAYSFQNAFFYLQWPDDPYVLASHRDTEASLITLRKTRRRSKLHPHKQRSKYLCRPRDVVETGNHFVWEFIPGHGTVNVPADAAILHHYRVCEFGGDDCVKTASVVDRTAYKYVDKLSEEVESTWQQINRVCPGIPNLKSLNIQVSKEFHRKSIFKDKTR